MNRPQLIIFGAIGAIVVMALLIITGVLPGLEPRRPAPYTLELWSFDDPEIWRNITENYAKTYPEASFTYVQKDPQTYETELVNALASGKSPDIFLMKDSWIAKHGDKLSPLQEGTLEYKKRDLKGVFADGLAEALTGSKNELLGVPLAQDTLALFYNRDNFNAAKIPNPPLSWDDFVANARTLTKYSEVGSIKRAGAAMGTAENVEHAPDILLLLIRQNGGANIASNQSAIQSLQAQSAIDFYTSFANASKKSYSWNSFFESSLAAFAKGDSSMAFGYASDISRIAEMNPQLNFGASPIPQPSQASNIQLGRFEMLSPSRTTKHANEAWSFLLWLENRQTQKYYIDQKGLPPARRDLVGTAPPREYLQPFYDAALSARTIPIPLGENFEAIFAEMIEGVVNHRFTIPQGTEYAQRKINEALSQAKQDD